jgi:hypothetical protein|tara:strand:- start:7008 stop:8147 length:1140 start_codon:yes stop_codon:yes gene_type:complete
MAKKKQARATRRVSVWETVPLDNWFDAQHHIHYMMESKEWLNKIKSYIKQNYDRHTLAVISKLPDWKVGGKSHWATAVHFAQNAPENTHPHYVGKLGPWIQSLVEEGDKIIDVKTTTETKKKNLYIPSIQDRLLETTIDKMDELDEWVDDWMRDSKKNPLKDKQPLQLFRKLEINLGHARFIQKFYEGANEELSELINLPIASKQTDMQQQLSEGYNTYTKAEQKELQSFYQRVMQALEIVRAEKKQTRVVRKPKQKSAVDLVKKLKFKPSDSDFGIVSVPPQDVVGSEAIVVFNCKTRKLGIYYAEDNATIQVKGTTLQFFDEKSSRQKTVRKPEEVLSGFKTVTKHKLKTQFGYLKTTDIKMNGRLNEDTVILKVFK